ncbi:unnamed protein product [Periconia digitata]|uniref:Uncharacterized protein n=1 Tax=Periconia digitata TaxID=1303443 RepID=A0A9W4XL37_9PLEO|nr:unnamed protein product [Periconia digitata]
MVQTSSTGRSSKSENEIGKRKRNKSTKKLALIGTRKENEIERKRERSSTPAPKNAPVSLDPHLSYGYGRS